MSGFILAQNDTATAPSTKAKAKTSTAHSSTGSAAKAKHPARQHTATKHATSHSATQKGKASRSKKGTKAVATKRGQQAIDADRAREIQTALIREHYMQGEASGIWDANTQAAMQRYQADHGWQSKTTPDSRALIKLGLGPSSDHLLNPESAMTMPAAPAASDPKAAKPTPRDDSVPQQ
jgi:peptidoglycan hydrolase-like protein with peptidoglycan-binding domain